MSVQVVKNTIIMTRGDTLRTKINIFDKDGNAYYPSDGDKIVFAAKKEYTDAEPCILKEVPCDTCILCLEPSDTKSLEQPCKYNYDIEITKADGTVDTFIKGILNIKEEVH